MSDFGKNGEENDNMLSKKLLNSMVKALFLANVPRIVRTFAPSKDNAHNLRDTSINLNPNFYVYN